MFLFSLIHNLHVFGKANNIYCFIDHPMNSSEQSRTQISQSYELWLSKWKTHFSRTPDTCLVPPPASKIHNPLEQSSWRQHIQQHLNQELVQYFLQGTAKGFRIGHKDYTKKLKITKDLQSATVHPEVLDYYIYKAHL